MVRPWVQSSANEREGRRGEGSGEEERRGEERKHPRSTMTKMNFQCFLFFQKLQHNFDNTIRISTQVITQKMPRRH